MKFALSCAALTGATVVLAQTLGNSDTISPGIQQLNPEPFPVPTSIPRGDFGGPLSIASPMGSTPTQAAVNVQGTINGGTPAGTVSPAEQSLAAVVAGARSLPICFQRCIAQGLGQTQCQDDDLYCICENIEAIDPSFSCAESTCYGESWKNAQQIFQNLCRDFFIARDALGGDLAFQGSDRGASSLIQPRHDGYEAHGPQTVVVQQPAAMPTEVAAPPPAQAQTQVVPMNTPVYQPAQPTRAPAQPTPINPAQPTPTYAAASTPVQTQPQYYPQTSMPAQAPVQGNNGYSGAYNMSDSSSRNYTTPMVIPTSAAGKVVATAWLLAAGGLAAFFL